MRWYPARRLLALPPLAIALALILALTLTACSDDDNSGSSGGLLSQAATPGKEQPLVRTVTPVLSPTPTPPPTATPAPSPTPSPTPVPQLTAGSAIVVGGDLRTRKQASTTTELVTTLPDHS